MYIKTIKKDYGKSIKILRYNHGVDISPPRCNEHQSVACQICWTRSINPVPSSSSLMRTKTKITDLTLANDFDLFCTFTFDPLLVDSFNYETAKSKMSKWLNNSRRNSPELSYLIIAELHKSGRIHFHALMKNYKGELTFTNKQKNKRNIYNMPNWQYGFSTAIKIDNIGKVSSYVQKYITKDMLKIGNKKRFWASRNLKKPTVSYNINMVEEVYSRPLFIMGQVSMEYYKIYKILKSPDSIPKVSSKKKTRQRKQELTGSH